MSKPIKKIVAKNQDVQAKALNKGAGRSFDITVLDDEKIEDLFTTAFRDVVDEYDNKLRIVDFDTQVVRPAGRKALKIEVRVYGMADVSSRNDLHNKKTAKIAEPIKKILVSVPDKGQSSFRFENSADLNTNDYILYYQLV